MKIAKLGLVSIAAVACTLLFTVSELGTDNDAAPQNYLLPYYATSGLEKYTTDIRGIGLTLSAEILRVRHGLWQDIPDQRPQVGEHALSALERGLAAPAPRDFPGLLNETILAAGLLDWLESDPAVPGEFLISRLHALLVRLAVEGMAQIRLNQPRSLNEAAMLTATAGVLLRFSKYESSLLLRSTALEILSSLDLAELQDPDQSAFGDLEYLRQGLIVALRDIQPSRSTLAMELVAQALAPLSCAPTGNGVAAQFHQAVVCEINKETPRPSSAQPLSSSVTANTLLRDSDNLPLGNVKVTSDYLVLSSLDDQAGGVEIFRSLPVNTLYIGSADSYEASFAFEHSPDSPAEFRAATMHDGNLYVVYYDNPSLTNYVLRAHRKGSVYELSGKPVALPSLQDPAGGTYEMIPQIQLFSIEDELHVVGGTLHSVMGADGHWSEGRLHNCSRAIESIATPQGPVVLCVQMDERGIGAPFSLQGPEGVALPELGSDIPFHLRIENGKVTISHANQPHEFAAMLRFDIERLNNGTLEYGVDNVEGRIPWSQIYYLNGFLDFLGLSTQRPDQWSSFGPLLEDMRARLDMEIVLLDQHWLAGRFETRAFSVDRSPQLFAVQTARLLLLMDRYLTEVASPQPLESVADLGKSVEALIGHIDELRTEGEAPWWLPTGQPFLAWPKGSAFYFDGLGVPYNHQNEWAYSLIELGRPDGMAKALDIIDFFLRRNAPDGRLPLSGIWDYWWGRAYDGWTEDMDYSINMPQYPGDHGKAWISFRSIDTMSVIAASPHLPHATAEALLASAAKLVADGKVYPFVAYELHRQGYRARPSPQVARRYVRVSSPWEVQNAAWAIDTLMD